MSPAADMAPSASNVYISAAFNRIHHVADWAHIHESTLVYASHKSIAIWKNPGHASSPQVTALIQSGFSRSISCLKFASLPSSANLPSIVAGAGDGSIAIWVTQDGQQWTRQHLLKNAHQGSISALGVIRPTVSLATSHIFVSGASDGLLKVWSTRDSEPKLLQTIDLRGSFPLDIALLQLPSAATSSDESQILMAVATTTKKIDLYASETAGDTPSQIQFHHKLSLEGHEDWVNSLDLCTTQTVNSETEQDTLMLASGSQDASVRLWKISPASDQEDASVGVGSQGDASGEVDEFEKMFSKIEADRMNQDGEISTRAYPFSVNRSDGGVQRWSVTFDALLIGHDNWVTGVRWHPPVQSSSAPGKLEQPAAILSSSADNSLILWTPSGQSFNRSSFSPFPSFDSSLLSTGGARRARGPTSHHIASSIWMPSQRFGEVGGASNLGFFGALWKPTPSSTAGQSGEDAFSAVVAHGWGGSAHIWTLNRQISASSQSHDQWQVASPVTGHFGPARSVAWEPCGEYFLSCSDDQTTRLHARPFSSLASSSSKASETWHEVARPQSHGYDLHSVTWLDRLNFVSAADEKVLRVFSAPRGFVGTVGDTGLACAKLGSENDSRAAVKAVGGRFTLLSLAVDPLTGLLSSAKRHGDLIRQAMENSFTSEQDTLTVVSSSSLFERPFSRVSFKQIELYLKWLYAQAWSVAIKKGLMLADVNVLLVPESKLGSTMEKLHSRQAHVMVDETIFDAQQALWSRLNCTTTTISSKVQYGEDNAEVGTDDGKGSKTYPVVALGGTFDHLHVGHKILLSMAALIAEEKIIVGVTDDAMLTKKSNAHLLEDIEERIASVNAFLGLIRLPYTPLEQEVVKLEDVAGPAATEAHLQALVVTDETLSGAEFIQGKRKENSLGSLENWVIGVVGSAGETDLKGDAKALAESKIGSTAIRKWLANQGPRFLAALETLKKHRIHRYLELTARASNDGTVQKTDNNIESRPVGASVPPLGLSNRAVFEGSKVEETPSASGQPIGSARESLSAILKRPPTEEQLSVETLWPELEKLYGHGYELLSVSANPANPGRNGKEGGRFVASCCRATSEDHAVVRIHDRERKWMECGVLSGHSLSITRIQWSTDSRFILSCSRDRSWRMYERKITGDKLEDVQFVPFTGERSHARIIWDVSWCKDADADSRYVFATASRDKTVKVFRVLSNQGEKPFALLQTIKFSDAITAISFGVGGLLAVGKESGEVEIFVKPKSVASEQGGGEEEWQLQWESVLKIDGMASEQINQLEFRPPMLEDGDNALLASASEDGIVRVTRIQGL